MSTNPTEITTKNVRVKGKKEEKKEKGRKRGKREGEKRKKQNEEKHVMEPSFTVTTYGPAWLLAPSLALKILL